MKKVGTYVARGAVTSGSGTSGNRIPLSDGKYTTGYRVKSLKISISSRDVLNNQVCSAMLSTQDGKDPTEWDWNDVEQIGWASCQADANSGSIVWTADDTVIDPNNMIIEDLYFYAYVYAYTIEINYMIELEKYEFKAWDGAALLVKNKSQAA